MKKEVKNIELTVNDIANVKKISFVHDPALETSFMYFSKEEYEFAKADVEKRLVTGLAMRADRLIPRINKITGEEYTVSFSPETVRLASELYLKDGNQDQVNLEHKYNIEGVVLVESYIINDAKVNNAVALGFKDVREGDWWVSMKVYNDELWNKFIKDGLVTGFSIEGSFVDAIATANENMSIDPKSGESEDDFMKRCVPFEINNGKEQDQAVAICYSKYGEKMSKCDHIHEDIIDRMIECGKDFDKLSNLVDEYLGFSKYPPYHLGCRCRLVDGKIVTHPEESNSGTCNFCLEKQKEWNSK